MKKFFYDRSKLLSSIKLHPDGFSMAGFSLRLSNIPQNLLLNLRTLTQNEGKLFSVMIFHLIKRVLSSQCVGMDSSDVFNNYFSDDSGNAHILIQHQLGSDFELTFNNACGLSPADQKEGSYIKQSCACIDSIPPDFSTDAPFYYNLAEIYGLNATDNLIECIENFITGVYCPLPQNEPIKDFVSVAAGCLLIGGAVTYCLKRRFGQRHPTAVSLPSPTIISPNSPETPPSPEYTIMERGLSPKPNSPQSPLSFNLPTSPRFRSPQSTESGGVSPTPF